MRNKKATLIVLILVLVSLIAAGVIWFLNKDKMDSKQPDNTSVIEETNNTDEAQAGENKTEDTKPKFEVKAVDGYTSYVINYVDTAGKGIPMTNEISLIKNGDKVYLNLAQAKEAGIFKEYIEADDKYYIEVKTDATFAWKITPKDTASIPNWTDSKAGVLISVNPDKSLNAKIVEYIVTLDYKDVKVQPTFQQSIK